LTPSPVSLLKKSQLRDSGALAVIMLATVLGLTGPSRVLAETAYISDNLTVPLRSGPSNANRILHRGLPSGTRLEVLARDEASGFVQIRTDRGTEGWLPAQYLVNEPIARDRLIAANQRIRDLSETIEQLEQRLGDISSGKGQADASNAQLTRQVQALERELAEIKRISAGAIAQNETNKELLALNDRLRAEVDELVATIAELEDNVQQRWLLIGGGLVLAGLVLGIAIKARPRRSAWS
jgi:SH3 domain protein